MRCFRVTFQQFHGNERMAGVLINVVNRADVRMIEGRGGLCFALKSFQNGGVAGNAFGQEFQRHETVELGVFPSINDTHATAPSFATASPQTVA
jgi:hypothetical protein